ncbi:MAG: hypothetical protein Q9192_008373 [Flavoplaca navasiana]
MAHSQFSSLPPEICLLILENSVDLTSAIDLAKTCKKTHHLWSRFKKPICESILSQTMENYDLATSLTHVQQQTATTPHTVEQETVAILHNAKEINRACVILQKNPFIQGTSPTAPYHFLPRTSLSNHPYNSQPSTIHHLPFQHCQPVPPTPDIYDPLTSSERTRISRALYLLWHLATIISRHSKPLNTFPLNDIYKRLFGKISKQELCTISEIGTWIFKTQDPDSLHPAFGCKGGVVVTVEERFRMEPTGCVWENAAWVVQRWAMERMEVVWPSELLGVGWGRDMVGDDWQDLLGAGEGG